MTQSWVNCIEILFVSHSAILVTKAILTNLFYLILKQNHFNVNLVKIHSRGIKVLSISCFVLFCKG